MVLQFWHNTLYKGKRIKHFHSNVQTILTLYADFFQMNFGSTPVYFVLKDTLKPI